MKTVVKQLPIGLLTLFVILLFVANAQAQTNNKLSDTDNGGFLEVNAGIVALKSRYVDAPKNIGTVADLRFSYYWNDFFLENRGPQGIGIPGVGYNFYNQDSWMLDLFITETHPAILWDDEGFVENGIIHEQDGLLGITPREADDRFSLRATRFIDDQTALRIVIAPVSDLKEINEFSPYLAIWYGKTWQYQNVNLHTIINAQYFSSSTLDYYYGVAEEDITDKFHPYKANSGLLFSAEFGMTYPLSSDWLLESSFKLTRIPDSIYKSPLISARIEAQAQISLTYVIF